MQSSKSELYTIQLRHLDLQYALQIQHYAELLRSWTDYETSVKL